MQMPGSTQLYSRCAVKTFKEHVGPILDLLSEESKIELTNVRLWAVLNTPIVQQNIPLLYFLIKSYSPEKNAFKLGKHYVKFTVNQVALILGLQNNGKVCKFFRTPFSEVMQKDIANEVVELAREEWSPTLEHRRVNALIRYALFVFFFPLKGLKIPQCLNNIRGVEDFRMYNWPKAIHNFLQSQFGPLSRIGASAADNSLGYIEGCFIVLVVRNMHVDLKPCILLIPNYIFV